MEDTLIFTAPVPIVGMEVMQCVGRTTSRAALLQTGWAGDIDVTIGPGQATRIDGNKFYTTRPARSV